MKVFSSKKRVAAIGAATAIALVGGGTAFAYWTTTGSGTGSTTAASGSVPITVAASVPTGIAPGLSRTVTFTASNTAGYAQHLTTIKLTSVTTDAAHSTCVVSAFTMPDVSPDVDVAAGASNVPVSPTGTLTMANTALAQDGCKGAPLTLGFTTS